MGLELFKFIESLGKDKIWCELNLQTM